MNTSLLDLLLGETITDVRGYGFRVSNDNAISYEEIFITTNKVKVYISTDFNTDEIVVTETSRIAEMDHGEFVDINSQLELCGKHFGWYWLGKNSQGYSDMLCFSFNGVVPSLSFVGTASSIKLNLIVALKSN